MENLIMALCFVLFLLLFASFLFLRDPWRGTPSLRVILSVFERDMKSFYRYMKARAFIYWYEKQNHTIASLFQRVTKKHPHKICFLFEDQKWTFQQVEDYSNQVANYFHAEGLQRGDEVSLFMHNRPEYACIWLGLSKIGVITALTNNNLIGHSLAHSINVINCKAVIYGAELNTAMQEAIPLLENKDSVKYYCLGNVSDVLHFPVKSLHTALLENSTNPPDRRNHKTYFHDKLLYIYTSGTTGLPKAAIMKQSRAIWLAVSARFIFGIEESDVIFNPLPMYHTSGGILSFSHTFVFGSTIAIAKKFSASNFWKDASKYEATVSQYIGETCRYLLAQPKKPQDTEHRIRMMFGNGLRSLVWKEFVERFKVQIMEFYGSTEGNANAVNLLGKVGAVGFISRTFGRIHPIGVIKTDFETGEHLRDENGLCIHCKPGEPGELVGRILRNIPLWSFDGYANAEATQKKIVKNCFEHGDLAFISGDVLVMDEEGYLYFVDRAGDTFRWRGENVSTSEVEDTISDVMGLADCVVYGVEIPGVEGRAGMAAIHGTSESFDLQSFYGKMSKALPSYAIPVFLRICSDIETTGTYKFIKVNLKKDGFDPREIKDPLYFLDLKSHSYVKLDEENYKHILDGDVKL